MPILGAFMSTAGGYYRALLAGAEVGCECVQLFTKNNNRWQAKPLTEDDVLRFKQAMDETGIHHTLSHASYLLNLASPKMDLRKKSIEGLIIELQRADALGIPHVVFHPGSYTTSTAEEGLQAIAESLNVVLQKTEKLDTTPLLENTAGQGTNLGYRFEHLAAIIEQVRWPERVGVCIDTCHAFAAGYPLASPHEYKQTVRQMDQTFGLAKIKAFHVNDSKYPLGARKDRHEHIGEGEMGLQPFRNLVNDRRFQKIPMYLETERGERNGQDLTAMDLATLRSLIKKKSS